MPSYTYTARDRSGAAVSATLEAPTRRDALRVLAARGLTPVRGSEAGGSQSGERKAKSGRKDSASPNTSAGGKPDESWPSPCEMFRRAAESVQSKGAEFSYALRSLRPVDPRNEPQTELEQRGLAFVTSHPTQNYYGQEMLGGRRYVTAIYPDMPAVAACVDCHNRRSASTPQHYQVGEVMGGIVVRVPLEF